MDKLKCLDGLSIDACIYQWSEYISKATYNLEKIDKNIHKACIEDDAVKLSRNILLKTKFKDKYICTKSPLELFKIGEKDDAFKLADLFFLEDRYLWYLLFIWYLKFNMRENEAKEVIDKMVEKKLVFHNGWIGDAINIIYGEVISIDPENLTKAYFYGLNSYSVQECYNIFLKTGCYEQVIEVANYLIEITLKDEKLFKTLLDGNHITEITSESITQDTEKKLNEIFSELINEVIKECISKEEVERAEKLTENITLDWAKVDCLLKIADYYQLIEEFNKAEAILKQASKLVIFIKDIKKRKTYIYIIADKSSEDKVINMNGNEVNIDDIECKEELDKFFNTFNDYLSTRKSDEYVECINRLVMEGNIEEAEKVLDTLPYDYDNWNLVRVIQQNYILLGDFNSAISVNEKYQYKISRLHGIIFVLDKLIKRGIDKGVALDIIEKNILESYKPCTRWNKCEELFGIAYTQGINGYIKEAKKSAGLGLKLLEDIHKGKSEFIKLAVKALAAAEEYAEALRLIETNENEDKKNYLYIEVVKAFTWKRDYIKAYKIIDKIQSKDHKSVALAEKALVEFKMKDEINGIKSLNSCYKLLRECKLNTSCYLKKVLCEIEGIRGNLDKAIEMIEEIEFMKGEAIESIIGYINNEEKLYNLLIISNDIDIKLQGYSYVNVHILIANSFKKFGNLKIHNKIKSDISTLVNVERENIWRDRMVSYIAKSELLSGDINSFLTLAREFSANFKGELYNIVNIFKMIKDKSVFKQFISTVDFTMKEAYYICEVIASLYPEASNRIAELIYEM
jgi:hypothetical protein